MAEMKVSIDGGTNAAGNIVSPLPVTATLSGTSTVTANQGTANTIANAWPHLVTDGTSTAAVTGLSALRVATGNITAMTTLNAVTANATGSSVALGSAHSNWSAVAVATGSPTAGTLTLELSHDGTNWVSSTVTASVTAAGNYLLASTGRAARFGRVNLTGLTGTITLTVTLMAAG
jgi:hypothetical protein